MIITIWFFRWTLAVRIFPRLDLGVSKNKELKVYGMLFEVPTTRKVK